MSPHNENPSELDRLRHLLKSGAKAVKLTTAGEITTSIPRESILLPGSFNPVHAGHWQLASVANRLLKRKVAFEISIANVDKPSMDWQELVRRLRPFFGRADLWITHAPRFIDKSALFPGAMFVVGADTAVRILDAAYYDGTLDLQNALATLRKRGCRFLVGGRMNDRGTFIGVDDLTIPPEFRDLFTGIPSEQFRADISSTSLREKQSAR